STTELRLDHYPEDPDRWKKEVEGPTYGHLYVIVAIIATIIIALFIRDWN
ncbi:MAG: hypothetical protein GWN39_15410, partial [Thermoplasmata archaeon]|nr:hypothetical protein [Thermoplasmata archaeon]NIS11548.1 hypothetical protein [Thermoplasmata archaeon]NIS21326.1 hypothetical protein [Thermoplasmata archaeon]NIT78849.1 hypothetical protein [Thermoplasmata archaeon]NIU50379.1 hypothetical protein [Thermoplasmata archaeon]